MKIYPVLAAFCVLQLHIVKAGYLPIKKPMVVVDDYTAVIKEMLAQNGGDVNALILYLLGVLNALGYTSPAVVPIMEPYIEPVAPYIEPVAPYILPYVAPPPMPLPPPPPPPPPPPMGAYPVGWGFPVGWGLTDSQVMTGGSASAGQNVLASGSTSADNGVFNNTKTHSRTRGSSTVGFGMIGGDGGDNNNVQKGGIEYNGGGIVNFLSKVQGLNNQGVHGSNDLWKYYQGYNKDMNFNNQGVYGLEGGYFPQA